MATKSAKQCLATGDFETAKSRYEATTKQWKEHWWDCLVQIYNKVEIWSKKYILDPVAKVVRKIGEKIEKVANVVDTTVNKRYYSNIILSNGVQFFSDGTQQFYLIRLLDKNNNLVYSKVGTTKRATQQRMKEHLKYYAKDNVTTLIVDRVWDCGDTEAESYESIFRSYYIKKYPNSFRKNDRFIKTEFDLKEADEMFEKWKNNTLF